MSEGKAKASTKMTLWSLICEVVSALVWFIIYLILSFALIGLLINAGFDHVPEKTWLALMAVSFVVAIPLTILYSWVYTEIKKWAKDVKLPF